MRPLPLFLLIVLAVASAIGQQSDYEVKNNYETRYRQIASKIDAATNVATLDSLKGVIDKLEIDFSGYREFLDKALYPETLAQQIGNLRRTHALAYNRISTIETQGTRIAELETQIVSLSGRLDTLTDERNKLFSQLEESRNSVAALRESIRRLTNNLQANDRLVFALVDSIFLPFGHDINQTTDVQKEAIETHLEKANVLTRVYDIAQDNVRFLEATQFQAKDFGNLIDQYQQFKNRWQGLSENLNKVAVASQQRVAPSGTPAAKGAKSTAPTTPSVQTKGALVDSMLVQWNRKLQTSFWSELEKEFTSKGVNVNHFTDAGSFSNSIRAFVTSLRESHQDPSVFVDDVWKDRVDKDWRNALERENMLGKAGYADLDRLVSDLSQKKIDLKLILYIVAVIVIAFIGWWLLIRRPRSRAQEAQQ